MDELLDNYDLWERHEAEREEALQKLPVCYECDEPIQDEHLYHINDMFICEKCMIENYLKRTEDFMEE